MNLWGIVQIYRFIVTGEIGYKNKVDGIEEKTVSADAVASSRASSTRGN